MEKRIMNIVICGNGFIVTSNEPHSNGYVFNTFKDMVETFHSTTPISIPEIQKVVASNDKVDGLPKVNDFLVGKTVKMIDMTDDPDPIPNGTTGVITHVGGDVINVKWSTGRTLGLVMGVDKFDITD